jgi:thymidylate kinase
MQLSATEGAATGRSETRVAGQAFAAIRKQEGKSDQSSTGKLLQHLEVNRVRHCVLPAGTSETAGSCIAVPAADLPALIRACRTLKDVKLVRASGEGGTCRIVMENPADLARRYSGIAVFSHIHESAFTQVPHGTGFSPVKVKSAPLSSLPPMACHSAAQPWIRWQAAWDKTSHRLHQAWQTLLAWVRPNGIFCVVLGPDGVGKSTTIQMLQAELQELLGPCTKQRWRPGFIRRVKPDPSRRLPHARPLRGAFGSVLFVLWVALDFTLGYAVRGYPAMVRSQTILFDRYFHDILIDPKRYGYTGPIWLPRLIGRVIPPRRALFIILDAEEGVILSRKQELPPEELSRQRKSYKAFGANTPRSVIVNTERSVDETVTEIVASIFETLTLGNRPN